MRFRKELETTLCALAAAIGPAMVTGLEFRLYAGDGAAPWLRLCVMCAMFGLLCAMEGHFRGRNGMVLPARACPYRGLSYWGVVLGVSAFALRSCAHGGLLLLPVRYAGVLAALLSLGVASIANRKAVCISGALTLALVAAFFTALACLASRHAMHPVPFGAQEHGFGWVVLPLIACLRACVAQSAFLPKSHVDFPAIFGIMCALGLCACLAPGLAAMRLAENAVLPGAAMAAQLGKAGHNIAASLMWFSAWSVLGAGMRALREKIGTRAAILSVLSLAILFCDSRIAMFAAAAALLCGLKIAILPAWWLSEKLCCVKFQKHD